MSCPCRSLFFFQAEDGIRARHVTGVQTCALPIWWRRRTARRRRSGAGSGHGCRPAADRKSVVEGKSVDLGGGRIIKKKKEGGHDAGELHRGFALMERLEGDTDDRV